MSQASSNKTRNPTAGKHGQPRRTIQHAMLTISVAGKSASVKKLKQFEKTPPDLGVMFKADVENIQRKLREETMSNDRRRQLESQLQTLLDLIAATSKK
ncbi:hypothetical protein EVG20_g457 [Dentipellis fragilis]|uniref:Uncharacterized protein n=1 Tax=Dentipellis fragilis TaxID=205917 RepID=A0A4Y9ZEW9_9AGAM|nr:hypothetical protein EVG20_g457 [Dentipellis fragilis]